MIGGGQGAPEGPQLTTKGSGGKSPDTEADIQPDRMGTKGARLTFPTYQIIVHQETGGVKVLFKRIALLLGSLHLALMASLGIWLWSDPRSFGFSDASCAVDIAHLAVVGTHVPFGSNPLRTVSLAIYGLFLLPGFNLLLPMTIFLGLYLWHQARLSEGEPPPSVAQVMSGNSTPEVARTIHFFFRIDNTYRSSVNSPVFPVFVGLALRHQHRLYCRH